MTKVDKTHFRVEQTPQFARDYYDQFSTLEEAQKRAQSQAWENGRDYSILKTVAIARAPEEVKNVKVDTL